MSKVYDVMLHSHIITLYYVITLRKYGMTILYYIMMSLCYMWTLC